MPPPRNKDKPKLTPLQRFRKNFAEKAKPDNDVDLPNKISVLSSDKLSDLQNHYSAWREFTEDLLVNSLAEATSARIKYEYEYDVKLLQFIPQTKTKVQAEAKTRVSEDIRKLYVSLSEAELYHELLGKKLESYNNALATISREITRRGNN
jgi:hypothetical protein